MGPFLDPDQPIKRPSAIIFANMDYLFWRISSQVEDHKFTWILWYIWKEMDNMVFSSIGIDPRDTRKLTDTNSFMWIEAHSEVALLTKHQVWWINLAYLKYGTQVFYGWFLERQ